MILLWSVSRKRGNIGFCVIFVWGTQLGGVRGSRRVERLTFCMKSQQILAFQLRYKRLLLLHRELITVISFLRNSVKFRCCLDAVWICGRAVFDCGQTTAKRPTEWIKCHRSLEVQSRCKWLVLVVRDFTVVSVSRKCGISGFAS